MELLNFQKIFYVDIKSLPLQDLNLQKMRNILMDSKQQLFDNEILPYENDGEDANNYILNNSNDSASISNSPFQLTTISQYPRQDLQSQPTSGNQLQLELQQISDPSQMSSARSSYLQSCEDFDQAEIQPVPESNNFSMGYDDQNPNFKSNNQVIPMAQQSLIHPSQPLQRLSPLSPATNAIPTSLNMGLQPYSDITTLVNSNSNIVVPLVESTFVDHRFCSVCGKRITRDMLRHMRTHQSISRFTCKFPKSKCCHKSGKFNRPYDFKKHLLNRHFRFDNSEVRRYYNLSDKLKHWGTCPCGFRFVAEVWLEDHILIDDESKKCPCIA